VELSSSAEDKAMASEKFDKYGDFPRASTFPEGRIEREMTMAEIASAPAALRCIECLRPWVDPVERWRLKITDDAQPETVPYCPDCATREFGPARPSRIEAA
jgi:hypothetical protein